MNTKIVLGILLFALALPAISDQNINGDNGTNINDNSGSISIENHNESKKLKQLELRQSHLLSELNRAQSNSDKLNDKLNNMAAYRDSLPYGSPQRYSYEQRMLHYEGILNRYMSVMTEINQELEEIQQKIDEES